MKKIYTLFFDETAKEDLPLVGGKGTNLGEMTKAKLPVPYGFCVTTESYKEFIELNNLSDFISQTIKGASLDNISQIGEEIRKRISQSEIPGQVEQEIVKAISRIGAAAYYAVRSSATAEDLAFASFAGQQDTYLNIKGEKNILDSVRSCWASIEKYKKGINDKNFFGVDIVAGATKTVQLSYDAIAGATVRMSRESNSYQRALVKAGIIKEEDVIKGRY